MLTVTSTDTYGCETKAIRCYRSVPEIPVLSVSTCTSSVSGIFSFTNKSAIEVACRSWRWDSSFLGLNFIVENVSLIGDQLTGIILY